MIAAKSSLSLLNVVASCINFDPNVLIEDEVLDLAMLNQHSIRIAIRLCTAELSACNLCQSSDCKREYMWRCVTYVTDRGAVISSCGWPSRISIIMQHKSKRMYVTHYPAFPYSGNANAPLCNNILHKHKIGYICYDCVKLAQHNTQLTPDNHTYLCKLANGPSEPFRNWGKVQILPDDDNPIQISHKDIVVTIREMMAESARMEHLNRLNAAKQTAAQMRAPNSKKDKLLVQVGLDVNSIFKDD